MEKVIREALKYAEKLGIDEIEIFVKNEKIKKMNFKSGLENMESSDFWGTGIRVIVDGKQALFSTTGFSENKLFDGIKIAYKMSRVSKKDPLWEGLPEKYGKSKVQVEDKKIKSSDFADIKDIWLQIKNDVGNATISRGNISMIVEKEYLFSYNDHISEERTKISSTIGIRYDRFNFQKYFSFRSMDIFKENLDTKSLVEKSKLLESAQKIKTGRYNIVLSREAVTKIFKRMLISLLSSTLVQKGSTPYIIEEQVGIEDLVIKDSGIVDFAPGSRGFDGDGQPTRETYLIEKGEVKNYIYDYYTAKIDGVETTGNAHRSFNSLPHPEPNNIIISSGDIKLEELDNYVYIDKIIGEKLSRPLSGLLNVSVSSGFLVKNGEKTPLTGFIIYDDFFDILKNRMKILKNQAWHENYFVPEIFIENVLLIGD